MVHRRLSILAAAMLALGGICSVAEAGILRPLGAGIPYQSGQCVIAAPGNLAITLGIPTCDQIETGIAAGGSNQASATALSATDDIHIITTVTAGTGVLLPTAVPGRTDRITNAGANALLVYPQSGVAIDAHGTNAAATIAVGASATFVVSTTSQIYSTQPGALSGPSSSTNGYVPTWNGTTGTLLNSGLASTMTIGGQSLQLGGTASVQGNGGLIQLSTGTLTSGHCLQADSNGNVVDAGGPCTTGGGGGTVSAGSQYDLAYYPNSGSTTVVSGLATANNGTLVTNGSGVPSISSTLPSAVQANITSVGTLGSGTWNGTAVGTQYGGSGANLSATGGSNQVVQQTTAGGAFTVGQIGFSNLSGSLSPSQCPNGTTLATGCLEVGGGLSVSSGIVNVTNPSPSSSTSGDILTFSNSTGALQDSGVALPATFCAPTGGSHYNPIINNGSGGCANDTSATLNAGALTLGASGTLGSITEGNATSGTVKIQPVTGALGTVTASLPANTGTIAELNLAQTWSADQTFNPNDMSLNGSTSGSTALNAAAVAGSTTATLPDNTGTIAELNYAQTWSAAQTLDSGDLKLGGSSSGSTTLNASATASGTLTLPAVTDTLAVLGTADQAMSGGVNLMAYSIGTVSSGTTTIDCGKNPAQYLTNNGAFTLAAPSNDGSCLVLITNGSSAGLITFSGFTEGSNTGDALNTTNTDKFGLSIFRINGTSHYLVSAYQ